MTDAPSEPLYYLVQSPTLNCMIGGVILPSAQAAGMQPPAGAVACTLAQCQEPSAWTIQNGALVAAPSA